MSESAVGTLNHKHASVAPWPAPDEWDPFEDDR